MPTSDDIIEYIHDRSRVVVLEAVIEQQREEIGALRVKIDKLVDDAEFRDAENVRLREAIGELEDEEVGAYPTRGEDEARENEDDETVVDAAIVGEFLVSLGFRTIGRPMLRDQVLRAIEELTWQQHLISAQVGRPIACANASAQPLRFGVCPENDRRLREFNQQLAEIVKSGYFNK